MEQHPIPIKKPVSNKQPSSISSTRKIATHTQVLSADLFLRILLGPVPHECFSNMAASASQTRVKEEVGRSIEKLEKEQLRGLQVSKKSVGACVT